MNNHNRQSDYEQHIEGYDDKHLLDLTDPQEPFYGDDPWYEAVDKDTEYQEAVSGTQRPF